jgi:hypothetical protein
MATHCWYWLFWMIPREYLVTIAKQRFEIVRSLKQSQIFATTSCFFAVMA